MRVGPNCSARFSHLGRNRRPAGHDGINASSQLTERGTIVPGSHDQLGICLGQVIRDALGDKSGIRRYGHFTLPMEETLVTTAIDLSGRYAMVFHADFPNQKIGDFDTELVEDFWQAVAANALCNLHVILHHGRNSHHISEAIFKSIARSLRMASEMDQRVEGIPSTKGRLSD